MKLLFENWRNYTDTVVSKLSESNNLLFEGEDLPPEIQEEIDKWIGEALETENNGEKIKQEISNSDMDWKVTVTDGILNTIAMARKVAATAKRCVKGQRPGEEIDCPEAEISSETITKWLGAGAAGSALGAFLTVSATGHAFEAWMSAFILLQASNVMLSLVKKTPAKEPEKPETKPGKEISMGPFKGTGLGETSKIFENWRKYLKEGYVLNSNEPPSIKDVILRWTEGEKAFEEENFHAMFPIDDLLEYRDFSHDYNKLPLEEMEKLKKDLRDVGVTDPIVVEIGKNGQAAIAHGNQIIELARQLNIKEVPVAFTFKDVVTKASKVTQEPATLLKNLEDQEENPLAQSMPGSDSALSLN